MARRFAKVSEEEIEEAFFYPSDLVNNNYPPQGRWRAVDIYVDTSRLGIYMLWFKLISPWFNGFWTGFNFIAIVPDYGNKYMTKENENWTSLKNFAPKLNLNHNNLYEHILCLH